MSARIGESRIVVSIAVGAAVFLVIVVPTGCCALASSRNRGDAGRTVGGCSGAEGAGCEVFGRAGDDLDDVRDGLGDPTRRYDLPRHHHDQGANPGVDTGTEGGWQVRYFVYYCDDYADNGGVGFEGFETREDALKFINGRVVEPIRARVWRRRWRLTC